MLFSYTDRELDLLARIMRAEALSEGDLGMLMVGNVVANRVLADCLNFKDIHTLSEAIYQSGQFTGTNSSLFNATATTLERQLAQRILNGEDYYPATDALWFRATNGNCGTAWYNQPFVGKYKNHCFYRPEAGICPQIY